MANGFHMLSTVWLVETKDEKHSLFGIFATEDDASEYLRQVKEAASCEQFELEKRAYGVSSFFRRQ
jgi:hypothetical protein